MTTVQTLRPDAKGRVLLWGICHRCQQLSKTGLCLNFISWKVRIGICGNLSKIDPYKNILNLYEKRWDILKRTRPTPA